MAQVPKLRLLSHCGFTTVSSLSLFRTDKIRFAAVSECPTSIKGHHTHFRGPEKTGECIEQSNPVAQKKTEIQVSLHSKRLARMHSLRSATKMQCCKAFRCRRCQTYRGGPHTRSQNCLDFSTPDLEVTESQLQASRTHCLLLRLSDTLPAN